MRVQRDAQRRDVVALLRVPTGGVAQYFVTPSSLHPRMRFGQQEIAQERVEAQPATALVQREYQHVARHERVDPCFRLRAPRHSRGQLDAELAHQRDLQHELHEVRIEPDQHLAREQPRDVAVIAREAIKNRGRVRLGAGSAQTLFRRHQHLQQSHGGGPPFRASLDARQRFLADRGDARLFEQTHRAAAIETQLRTTQFESALLQFCAHDVDRHVARAGQHEPQVRTRREDETREQLGQGAVVAEPEVVDEEHDFAGQLGQLHQQFVDDEHAAAAE